MDSLLTKMMNMSVSCNSRFFSAICLRKQFHGCIIYKNGEHISVSCNSSFYSTIWLDKFHGGITHKNGEHIPFSFLSDDGL